MRTFRRIYNEIDTASMPAKMRYAHQGGHNPPVVVVHGNALAHVSDGYRRYLEGWFRELFDLAGTPLRIEFRTSTNPYADDRRRAR